MATSIRHKENSLEEKAERGMAAPFLMFFLPGGWPHPFFLVLRWKGRWPLPSLLFFLKRMGRLSPLPPSPRKKIQRDDLILQKRERAGHLHSYCVPLRGWGDGHLHSIQRTYFGKKWQDRGMATSMLNAHPPGDMTASVLLILL